MENKPHILVVDDDDKIRNLLKEFLNAQDFYVTTASNAEDAEKILGINTPIIRIKGAKPRDQLLCNSA